MRIVGNPPSGGKKPTTPTIGTATDGGTGTTVSVAFTPSTYIGKDTITYTATSSPGSLTASGSGSPLTVSGLTTGTAYTFTVAGNTNYGVASDSSAASNSVTPASPSSFESIATANPTTGSTVTFSSIPSTYKHLQIRALVSGNNNGTIRIQFNGDTGSNYSYHRLTGYYLTSGTVSAGGGASQTDIRTFNIYGASNSSLTNIFAAGIIDIIDYVDTTKNKTTRAFTGKDLNGNATYESQVTLESGAWYSTSAINSITLTLNTGGTANFVSGTQFALYGIKG